MTLADLAAHVARRVGVSDDDTTSLAKEFIKRRYKSVYDQQPWLESHQTFTFRSTTNEVILPDWVDKIVQVRVDQVEAARNLQMVSRQTVMLVAPDAMDDDGARTAYSLLPSVAVHTHPGGKQITVQSSDTSDTTQEVRVRGLHNGLTCEDTIQLAGTTPVTASYYFDEIVHLSKPTTAGWVTVKNTAATPVELQVLLPVENERRHQRIQLHYDYETGAAEEVFTVLCKRRCTELVHDNDTPQLVNIDDALVAYAVADMLERERQFGKAALKVQEAISLVNGMILAERDQGQNHSQIIPVTESYAEQSSLY